MAFYEISPTLRALMKFTDLNLVPPILEALKIKGYTEPTPIQAQSIPVLLKGKDLLGVAQTGTGKTASFAIPTLQTLYVNKEAGYWPKGIKALVITPTRELAIQIDESFAAYGKGMGIRHSVIFGGVKQHHQVRALQRGVDILTATPGRLLDLMNQGFIKLDNLRIFTLDEADRMLDMGFINDVKKVIAALPDHRQSMFFSATMPPSITDLANTLLTNPTRVEVAPASSTADTVDQYLFMIDKHKKRDLLRHVLDTHTIDSVLVFTRTKHGANKLAKHLTQSGITADAIHGNKSQAQRQRALKNFKAKKVKVLVATDIAARGIDVSQLSHVINFEIPNEPESYVHRIGRTGRAKNTGIALSFCDIDERAYVKSIHKLINKEIPIDKDHPFPAHHNMEHPEIDMRPNRKIRRRPAPRRHGSFGNRNRR